MVAGIAEWGWPVELELAWSEAGAHWFWIAFAAARMVVSGWLRRLMQRKLPTGTTYAVRTGCGAVGTFTLDVLPFGKTATLLRYYFVGISVAGIAGLRMLSCVLYVCLCLGGCSARVYFDIADVDRSGASHIGCGC